MSFVCIGSDILRLLDDPRELVVSPDRFPCSLEMRFRVLEISQIEVDLDSSHLAP